MIRPPAVAGRFYPSDPRELTRQIDEFAGGASTKLSALACVVPHAGYLYSGHVAGAVYAALEIPARCILLGPRHYPQGQPMAILSDGKLCDAAGRGANRRLAGRGAGARVSAAAGRRRGACPRTFARSTASIFAAHRRRAIADHAGGAGHGSLRPDGRAGARGGAGGEGAKRAGAHRREFGYEPL